VLFQASQPFDPAYSPYPITDENHISEMQALWGAMLFERSQAARADYKLTLWPGFLSGLLPLSLAG